MINAWNVNILSTSTCQQVLGRFINGKETLSSSEKEKDEWMEVLLKGFPRYSSPSSFLNREKTSEAASTAPSKGIRLVFRTMW